MAKNPEQEAVVIGGGPAGLATAIVLARNGVRVTVLDRQRFPLDKVCGEGVMPPGLAFLEDIGALGRLAPEDSASFVGIRYLSASGRQAQAPFEAGPGRGIRRTALSRVLLEVAEEFLSLEIRQGVRVTGLRRDPGEPVLVECSDGSALPCRIVIGADGLRSRVRRWAGLEAGSLRRKRFGIRRHFRCPPWSRFVEVHGGADAEAYVTPCGSDCVGVAILWEPDRSGRSGGGDAFDGLSGRFPALAERLSGLEPLDPPRATGPFQQFATRRTARGLVLVGDASGYLDPCTGEGLTLAFKQALALEGCLVPELGKASRGEGLDRAALAGYERAWGKIMRPYFLCTRAMMFGQRHPRLFESFLRMAGKRPEVLQHFLSFNMGMAPAFPGFRKTARWFLPGKPTGAVS